jgi:hypothetical protein
MVVARYTNRPSDGRGPLTICEGLEVHLPRSANIKASSSNQENSPEHALRNPGINSRQIVCTCFLLCQQDSDSSMAAGSLSICVSYHTR